MIRSWIWAWGLNTREYAGRETPYFASETIRPSFALHHLHKYMPHGYSSSPEGGAALAWPAPSVWHSIERHSTSMCESHQSSQGTLLEVKEIVKHGNSMIN